MNNQEPIIAYDHLEDEYKDVAQRKQPTSGMDKTQFLLYISEEVIVIMLFISMFLMV